MVQWSSIRAFGARDPGSNPGGAIKPTTLKTNIHLINNAKNKETKQKN